MTFMPHSLLAGAHPSRRWVTFARHTVSVLSVLADAAAIIGISILMGSLYHVAVYGELGRFAAFSASARPRPACSCCRAFFAANTSSATTSRSGRTCGACSMYWNITFVALLALAFLTRLMDDYSRASMVLFYVAGLPALLLMRYAVVSLGDPRQPGRAGHRAARIPDRHRRRHLRLRAPLSAVEFRSAHGGRRAADAARLIFHARGAAHRARSRPAPGGRQRAHAQPRRGLHRHAMVRDRHDRFLRRGIPQDAGRDPSRAGAHPRPLRQCAHRQARPHGEPAAHARAAQLGRAHAQAHLRRDGRRPAC